MIAGHPSEVVTLEPPDGQEAIRLTSSAPHYLIFQDLVVDMARQTHGSADSGPNAIFLSGGAHHNRFQRLEIKNNTTHGLMFGDESAAVTSPFNEVLNCSIHDNGRYPGTNSGYGAYIFSSDNLFEGNDVYNNGGYGLHFYSNHGPLNVTRNVIRGNKIHDNGTHGGTNYGIVVAWGADNLIYDNSIYGNRGGILIYTNSSSTQVHDNTIYNNTSLEGILIQYATGAIVRDNVVYGNGVDILDLGSGTVISSNRSSF
jgi:parallel beta-helix repeat protein